MEFTKMESRALMRRNPSITRAHICNWRHGRTSISLKYLPDVAAVKGISVGVLVTMLLEEQQQRTVGAAKVDAG